MLWLLIQILILRSSECEIVNERVFHVTPCLQRIASLATLSATPIFVQGCRRYPPVASVSRQSAAVVATCPVAGLMTLGVLSCALNMFSIYLLGLG